MRRIREKCWLVAFNQVAEPRQRKSSWDEKQRNDPMEPDHNQRREADWDGNQVQRTIYRMIVCAVVMRVKAHVSPRRSAEDYGRGIDRDKPLQNFVSKIAAP